MGEINHWLLQANGYFIDDQLYSLTTRTPALSNPSPESVSEQCWERAEETAARILARVQPTVAAEAARKDIIEYLQGLIGQSIGSQVFPFGSVPLKTYLPDGDIDLTAVSSQALEDSLASEIRAVLEREEHNKDAEFQLQDVQFINAEVKLLKCLVQNIVIDISFNQLGGMCTLCFLEQVDRFIGKNHLFKRSIMLIKAWCYYESRILGAHYGLISTYALETMVLYIFHLFHSSLDGPIAVLYRFLDYYSKFQWENFCISLNGPVRLSSLPEIVAETPDNDGGELLLDKNFLRKCVEMFSVPSKGSPANSRSFSLKNMNIMDPLKESNNLGRSVSKGNFYRIRSAFNFGSRKLGQILLLTAEDIADELNKFFTNTLERHGNGQRPDVHVPTPISSVSESDCECPGEETALKSSSVNSSVSGDSLEATNNPQLSGSEKNTSIQDGKKPQILTSSMQWLERFGYIKENSGSGCRLVGNAEDPATSKIPSSVFMNRTPLSPQAREFGTSEKNPLETPYSDSFTSSGENGNTETRNQDQSNVELDHISGKDSEASSSGTSHNIDGEEGTSSIGQLGGTLISSLHDSVDASVGSTGSIGPPNSLSDLTGDYNNHLKSLICARLIYSPASPGHYLPMSSLPSQFQNNHAFDSLRQSMQPMPNVFPHMNANGAYRRSASFPQRSPRISGAAEEGNKPAGLGTFFPSPTDSSQDMILEGRRSAPPLPNLQLTRQPCDSNWVVPNMENLSAVAQFRQSPSQATLSPPGFFQDSYYVPSGISRSYSFTPSSEKLEFGSFGQSPTGGPSLESNRQPASNADTQAYSNSTSVTPRPGSVSGVNDKRNKDETYHLKNEDFPPLSYQ